MLAALPFILISVMIVLFTSILPLISTGIGALMTIGTTAAVLMGGKKVVHKKRYAQTT